MKNKVFILFILSVLPFIGLSQNSQREKMTFNEYNYYVSWSVIRNYDSIHNIIAVYGRYSNVPTIDYEINEKGDIYLQNLTNGQMTHIVSLPRGYKITDIDFVELEKMNTNDKDPYCCFCGTKSEVTNVVFYPALPGEPSTYSLIIETNGFAGFFRMNEALSPNSSYTAEIREVEGTSELNRLVCYAERYGQYSSLQNTYKDNAVLDIVGIPSSGIQQTGARSSLSRVKFYPAYPTLGISRWDNNIRYNTCTNEVMTDITEVGDDIVTVSHIYGCDSILLLRKSQKESTLSPGGLELSSIVYVQDLATLTDNVNLSSCPARIEPPARLSPVSDYEFGLSFQGKQFTDEYSLPYTNGVHIIRYNATTNISLIGGYFDKCSYSLKDFMYLPISNTFATLYSANDSTEVLSATEAFVSPYMSFPLRYFSIQNSEKWHTGCVYKRLSKEGISISGESNDANPQLYIDIQQNYPLGQTCFDYNTDKYNGLEIESFIDDFVFLIKDRYAFEYEGTIIKYSPFNPVMEIECKKGE